MRPIDFGGEVTAEGSNTNGAHESASGPVTAMLERTPVSVAFAVGWQMVELYAGAACEIPPEADESDRLPTLEDLGSVRLAYLGVDQVEAGLRLLKEPLDAAGSAPVDTCVVRDLLGKEPLAPDRLSTAIEDLHVDLMLVLTAADFRLGKAYRLGCSLAKTALLPDDRDSFEYAFGTRIDPIKDWLADLSSTLPAHAARAVAASVVAWDKWAAEPLIDGRELDWEADWAIVRPILFRQGQLWRALLSGEKQGVDMLETDALVRAGQGLVGQASALAWRALRRLWPFAAGVVGLVGIGVAALVLAESEAVRILGAIVAAAGGVGLTWRGLMTRASKIATDIESRLWGAELDLAIAVVITEGPDRWGVDVADVAKALPAAGAGPQPTSDLEVLAQFRAALADERLGKPKRIVRAARYLTPDTEYLNVPSVLDKPSAEELLSPYARFVPDGDASLCRGRTAVLAWLADPAQRDQITSGRREMISAGRGRYVELRETSAAEGQPGADYWVVRHGSILLWERHADANSARAVAGLPPAVGGASPDQPSQ